MELRIKNKAKGRQDGLYFQWFGDRGVTQLLLRFDQYKNKASELMTPMKQGKGLEWIARHDTQQPGTYYAPKRIHAPMRTRVGHAMDFLTPSTSQWETIHFQAPGKTGSLDSRPFAKKNSRALADDFASNVYIRLRTPPVPETAPSFPKVRLSPNARSFLPVSLSGIAKNFYEDEDRPEKPRRYGMTEMRGPHYSLPNQEALQILCQDLGSYENGGWNDVGLEVVDILESLGQFVDGLKFSGGSHSLLPKSFIKEITDVAHRHDVYVSTGDWAEYLLRKGPSAFEQYLEECKQLGFDTIELNASSLQMPEEALLRFVRLIKKEGLKVKPQFAVKFDSSDIPTCSNRAFGAYIAPVPKQSGIEVVEDVDLLIRRAERCLEAGADMIMIDADDVCKYADHLRADIVAKIISRLGLEKTMFEASGPKTSEWFVKRYGPRPPFVLFRPRDALLYQPSLLLGHDAVDHEAAGSSALKIQRVRSSSASSPMREGSCGRYY
ncbi:hypothetical protein ACLOJK_039643 [Asimina triloba]